MKASSAKAKGRRAAQELKRELLRIFGDLENEDIRVTPSGVNGPDLQLSPLAKKRIPFDIEVKNQERLNIWASLKQSETHGNRPLLVFTKNRTKLYASLPLSGFLDLLKKGS